MAGIVTIESLNKTLESIRKADRDRALRIFNCEVEDTDCFLSIHASRSNEALVEEQIRIIENEGTAWFDEYATLDNQLVDARWVETRYGESLVVNMPDGSTVWTTAQTEKGLARKGLKKVRVRRVAWAKHNSNFYSILPVVYPANLNRFNGEYEEDRDPIEIKF